MNWSKLFRLLGFLITICSLYFGHFYIVRHRPTWAQKIRKVLSKKAQIACTMVSVICFIMTISFMSGRHLNWPSYFFVGMLGSGSLAVIGVIFELERRKGYD